MLEEQENESFRKHIGLIHVINERDSCIRTLDWRKYPDKLIKVRISAVESQITLILKAKSFVS